MAEETITKDQEWVVDAYRSLDDDSEGLNVARMLRGLIAMKEGNGGESDVRAEYKGFLEECEGRGGKMTLEDFAQFLKLTAEGEGADAANNPVRTVATAKVAYGRGGCESDDEFLHATLDTLAEAEAKPDGTFAQPDLVRLLTKLLEALESEPAGEQAEDMVEMLADGDGNVTKESIGESLTELFDGKLAASMMTILMMS